MRRLACVLVLAACGDDAAVTADAGSDAAGSYRYEVVRELTVTRDTTTYPVQLVRIDRPDGGRTYAQWIRTTLTTPHPAVVSTDPYGGIDWSGEEVDTRWASRGAGLYEDTEQPDYDGSAQISYAPITVDAVNDAEMLHVLNGASALHVHGRFYAGGSVGDDIEDMKAGMWFLAEQDNVTDVGVWGGSWGGFEAVYASAFGDRRVAPRVTVALYPPVDFSEWLPFGHAREEPVYSALEGHRRRIEATTGPVASADYTGLRYADLCAGLPADTLVLHDELDNLVPIRQSEQLVATCGGDAVYWRRAADPDPGAGTHGPLLEGDEAIYPSAYTYALAYLYRRLNAAGPWFVAVSRPALVAHLTTLRDAQLRGEDTAFAPARLRELVHPQLYMLDFAAPTQIATGAEVVATAVNAVWGTSYTAMTIDAALASGLPSPPP